MSMNETARDSARQKNEARRHEKETLAKIEALSSQLEQMLAEMDAQTTNQTTQVTPRSMEMLFERVASRLEALERAVSQVEETGAGADEIRAVIAEAMSEKGGPDAAALTSTVNSALDAIQNKEARAAEMADEMEAQARRTAERMEQVAEQAEGAWGSIEGQDRKIERMLVKMKDLANRLSQEGQKASDRVDRAASRLGLKAALIAMVTTAVAILVVAALGWWWMDSEGMRAVILTPGEQQELEVGKKSLRLYNNHWSPTEQEKWKALQAADQAPGANDKTNKTEETTGPEGDKSEK
jgi:hypothetical protein